MHGVADPDVWIARALRCASCAGPLTLDERAAVLKCAHCGQCSELGRGDEVAWHSLSDADLAESANVGTPGAGSGPPTFSCAHCGAVMTRRPGALATQCHYCLSQLAVQEVDARVEAFDGIVPFEVAGTEARQKFVAWLSGAWFAPGDLARAAKLEELDSIYVPCHVWRASARTEWSARVGILTTAAEDRAAGRARPEGDPGHVRTRWEDQHGVIDQPVLETESASRVVTSKELLELGSFEITRVVAYHQGYLGTRAAELPTFGRNESYGRMLGRLQKARSDLAESRIEAERSKNFRAETKLDEAVVRLLLVPIYLVAYRYKGEVFRVLVHGESGQVSGDHPLSPWKIGLLLLTLAALALAVLVLVG